MTVTVVVGGFFGDEGKGKIVAYLAVQDEADIVVRGGAGPNAGHTIRSDNTTYKIRMIPSGFLNPNTRLMIGPGVVLNPQILDSETKEFGVDGRIFVDRQCGIIEETHIEADSQGRLKTKIGSTGSGTGPANADRAMRTLRTAQEASLENKVCDVPREIHQVISRGGSILVEGTQGTFLSLWHGTYPYVTSKDVTASGVCADVGIGPTLVDHVIMVVKAYTTRVGTGPLKHELDPEEVRSRGWAEWGTVTGRPRRAADIDYDLGRRSVMLNGATQIALTKLDVRFPDCSGVVDFDDLSNAAKNFIKAVEDEFQIPVTLIGTGPSMGEIIDLRTTK